MHVGKAVEGEGRREGLYIRWAFILSASLRLLRQISSAENQDSILTHRIQNLILYPIQFDGQSVFFRQGSQFGRGVWHQIVGETAEQGTSKLHFNCNGFW